MRSWRALVGFLISAVFLYVAFRGQDFGEIRDAILETNLWWVPVGLILYFAGVWVRALRWKILLRPLTTEPSTRSLLPIVIVGFTANNVLPLRAGELVRSLMLDRRHHVRKTSALATIAVERIFDGLAMLAFLALSMTFVSLTSELRHLAIISFLLFAGLLIGLFLLTFAGDLVERLMQLVLGPLPGSVADRIERMMESFLGGLGSLRRRGDLAKVAGTSLLAWLCEAAMYWVLAIGFGGTVREAMTPAATLLTTSVANLSTLIPGAPGYVGQFEYGVKLVLGDVMHVSEGQALAYAILVHALLYIPITLIGVVIWFRQEMSLAQVRREDAPEGEPASALSTDRT
ncbi:MAG TPA: lysylphosphatidylglycerol synthase transmembrane domain-containing protein [Thermomicrobiales bacterium]|nr:lysylphosphatidylglycerol synthase transmembrane domain-containing protein [Thermomicrobiales bacterium]